MRVGLALALSLFMLAGSLLVDVGVARAAEPGDDGGLVESLAALGGCVIVCGGAVSGSGALVKYGLGAQCVSCTASILGRIRDYARGLDSNCYTGVLGEPCTR